jgi:hypothetical protein
LTFADATGITVIFDADVMEDAPRTAGLPPSRR